MASEPMTEAGKRLLDALWIAIDSANVQTLAFQKDASRMVAAIEAEAADLPRRWPKGPTDRDGNPLPATPAETGLREAAQAFVDHVAEAAEWPTPGIGCDAKCLQAGDLRTALSKEERP